MALLPHKTSNDLSCMIILHVLFVVSCVKVKLICVPIDKMYYYDPPDWELNKKGLTFVLGI